MLLAIVAPGKNSGVFRQGLAAAAAEQQEKLAACMESYRKLCQVCHGADGRGTPMKQAMPAIPDFTNATWQEGRTNPELLISITDGKGAQMPAFSDRLNNDQAHDLVSLIRAFKETSAKPNK
jgi:cytochrome c oxidase cbb3-type subunit 3